MQKKIIGIIAVVMVMMVGYVAYDSMSGKLQGKKVDDESVVYSIDDTDIKASEYYDMLDKSDGDTVIANVVTRLVLDNYPTSDEVKTSAAEQAANVISYYSKAYPENYKEMIAANIRAAGYDSFDDLQRYMENTAKIDLLINDYVLSNFDDLNVRKINYLLIKFDDVDSSADHSTATDAEKARMDAVDAMLAKDGVTFEDVAKEYSEDESTASNGGYLGIIDKNTTGLDDAFLKAALSLQEGEISDWVYSENFGWFRIMNSGSTPEKFTEPETDATEGQGQVSPFESLLTSFDPGIYNRAIIAKAEEYGITFANDELKTRVYTQFGITDGIDSEAGKEN